ncbi:recombinase family protein [Bacillus mycoides]|uniref:recombinase family protein n=1 Tax=Bacillus mycoides TaxID=1405 RepID=UPI0011A7A4DD|nr:recombinase family protein [Bacillus mycoides]
MKCAIYRRVSTDMQAEKGSSLEAQKERLNAFAVSQGWEVASDYVDDGYSAKNMNRPALQRMLSNMKDGQFDIILVYKLDRLCRSVRDLNDMIREFEKYHVKFKSSTESLDTTTATGRMMMNIIGTLAQWEREQTAERVSMILNERSKKGLWNGGPMPYGYVFKNGEVTIIKDEAQIVQFCFDKAITHGAQSIAKLLNEKGYRTRDGYKWIMRSILRMLHNPLYKGYRTYANNGEINLTKVNINGFNPIITKELFDKVQYIIKKRTITSTRVKNDSIFPLSGILICPKCGGRMSGTTITTKGTWYRYYRCSKVVHGVCNQQLINENIVDDEFSKMFTTISQNVQVNHPSNNIDKTTVEKQLTILDGKRERIKELYIEGDINKNEYHDKLKKLNDQKEELILSLENVNQEISNNEISIILKEMNAHWKIWTREMKAKIVRGLFEEVHIQQINKRKFKITDHKFI